jgi:AraC-like DNA-binding protein
MSTIRTSVPRELTQHRVFEGTDLEEARAIVGRFVNPHSLRVLRPDERLNVRQHAVRIEDVTLTHLAYGATVEIGARDVATCFCVQMPVAGTSEVECGHETLRSSPRLASVPTPVEPLKMRWRQEAAHLIIKIEQAALERYLAQLLGHGLREPIRLQLGMDLRGPIGARWRSIVQLLLAEIAQRDSVGRQETSNESALLATSGAAIEEIVMSSLLLLHPNNYGERLRAGCSPAAAPYVRRAIEYVRDHLDTPVTIARLAATTGVSARALQKGFARDLGCTPSAYVRDLRLERARKQLLDAEPGDGTRVTDVALRWGFSHLGRFSHFYGVRFGESPSDTLRARTGRCANGEARSPGEPGHRQP